MTEATHPAIVRNGQSLDFGAIVHLYLFDLNPIGVNEQFAFTTRFGPGRKVLTFRGIPFLGIDVECEGFAFSGTGAMPTPVIRVTNAKRLLSSAAVLYKDLVGAKLTRLRTYAQFLDDGATPDPEAAYTPDVYRVEQKTGHNKRQIEFTLASPMDQEGREIPGREIIKDVCMWRYRRWDPDAQAFNYDHVKCPYTGDQAYDVFGQPTTPDKDTPSRRVATCCKVRFGAASALPFGGFPGVTRVTG